MPNFILTVNSTKPLSLGSKRGKDALRAIVNRLLGELAGGSLVSDWQLQNSETSGDMARPAGAVWISSSGSGTMSAVINGTTVSVTYATSDANTAGLMETAINANATASKYVEAHRYVAKVTLASVIATDALDIFGTPFVCQKQNATATVTMASAQAGDTVTVNGTVFTGSNTPSGDQFDTSGTDADAATSLAAAVNASTDAGVSGIITANAAAAVVTVRAVNGGTAGNAYTMASSNGTRLAVSGALFTGGVAGEGGRTVALQKWDVGYNDTTCADDLVRAINAHPVLSARCFALNTAGVVYIALREDRAARGVESILSRDSTITVNNQIAQGAVVAIMANTPGIAGNACTLTASGTGASVVSEVSGKLGGGVGGDAAAERILSSQV